MKVLFTPITSSSIAHVVRSLALAEELKKRGHSIFFTSCTSKSKFIEDQGYKVVKTYRPVNMNDPKDQSINYMRDHRNGFVEWFKAELDAANEIQPDVVIQAAAIFGPHIAHVNKNIPVISIMDSQYLPESKGLMGISLSTDRIDHKFKRSILKPIFEKKFIELYLSEILEIYKELGIKNNIRSREDLYKPMKILIPSDEILEPLKKNSNTITHVGPLFWNGFEEMKTDLTEEFILKFKNNHKLIFLTFGASVFNLDTYNSILKTFLEDGLKTIVCIGPNFNRNEFPADTDNVLIRNLVPGQRLCRLSDLIISTGSQGFVMQGLTYGKPQVTFPTTMDQAFFGNRLEELGLGINANKISLKNFSKRESYTSIPSDVPDRIIRAVEKILQDPNYSNKCKVYSKNLESYKDASRKTALIIENYIRNHGC
jgi:UDP:flavonoid glycosyltransferase YjiC (YdhE family)